MSTDEYKAVLETVRTTLDGALKQNEALIQGMRYYADGGKWQSREIPMMDRGERARKILAEVMQ
jgi:hypothetical protein